MITTLDIDRGEAVAPTGRCCNWPIFLPGASKRLTCPNSMWRRSRWRLVTVTFDALPALLLRGRVRHVRPVGENSHTASLAGAVSPGDAPLSEQLRGDIVHRAVVELETHEPLAAGEHDRVGGFYGRRWKSHR